MNTQTWGVLILLFGVLTKTAVAASDTELPYWSIIVICLACILVMITLLCLFCIICSVSARCIQIQDNCVRPYFPHLAFRCGLDENPNNTINGQRNGQCTTFCEETISTRNCN